MKKFNKFQPDPKFDSIAIEMARERVSIYLSERLSHKSNKSFKLLRI